VKFTTAAKPNRRQLAGVDLAVDGVRVEAEQLGHLADTEQLRRWRIRKPEAGFSHNESTL
jgi:hypothetical protein